MMGMKPDLQGWGAVCVCSHWSISGPSDGSLLGWGEGWRGWGVGGGGPLVWWVGWFSDAGGTGLVPGTISICNFRVCKYDIQWFTAAQPCNPVTSGSPHTHVPEHGRQGWVGKHDFKMHHCTLFKVMSPCRKYIYKTRLHVSLTEPNGWWKATHVNMCGVFTFWS